MSALVGRVCPLTFRKWECHQVSSSQGFCAFAAGWGVGGISVGETETPNTIKCLVLSRQTSRCLSLSFLGKQNYVVPQTPLNAWFYPDKQGCPCH